MANIEATQPQDLMTDQIDDINAEDVKFNMENYEMMDKIPENEKKEYEELNKQYKGLVDLASKLNLTPAAMKFMEKQKKSYLLQGTQELHICSASRAYKIATLHPYKKAGNMSSTLWPNKSREDMRPIFDEGNGKTTSLSVKGYGDMLNAIKTILGEEETVIKLMEEKENKAKGVKENELVNSL